MKTFPAGQSILSSTKDEDKSSLFFETACRNTKFLVPAFCDILENKSKADV